MKEFSGRKASLNVPLDWALTQIIYSYDEGITKSDIVAMAIRINKGKPVTDYISAKLTKEYPKMGKKEMLAPDLTPSGRRSLLHVNVPVELIDNLLKVAEHSEISINKTVNILIHKLYDSDTTVTATPRAKQVGIVDTVRIAINFPILLVDEVNDLNGSPSKFRSTVIKALEEYVGRNLDGGAGSTKCLGT